MPYEPTVWQDHVTEYPGEYQIKKTSRGTYNIVPVGKVIQEGTPQNAKHFNKIEDALCTLFGLLVPLEIKTFNSIEEMQAYNFDKGKLYHFQASSSAGALLGGQGYCYGRYYETTDPETDEVTARMLEVFNSTVLKVWKLNLTEGTPELLSCGNYLITVETVTVSDDDIEAIVVTGISLDYTSVNIEKNQSLQLAASIIPSNAANTAVVWESSNSEVAKVDNGLVTAIATGNCTIKAISAENADIYATCTVVVESADSESESGEPGVSTGEVLFSTLTPVKNGAVLNKNGTSEFTAEGAAYYSLPYSEGMEISTLLNPNWEANYPPVIVIENGVASIPKCIAGEWITGNGKQYTTTLSGYTENVTVYVNVSTLNEYCYYIAGGAE